MINIIINVSFFFSQWWTGSNKTPNRPHLLLLESAFDVLLEGFTLLNPAAWTASLGGARYRIKDVKIQSPEYSIAPNTDGLDIHAIDVHVSGCHIHNGDDSICIKSPAHNVLVENCTVSQGNGLVVGTSDNVNISNITFRNCTAENTLFGCHIKFKDHQIGVCQGITFEDIYIDHPKLYAIGINQNGQGDKSDESDESGEYDEYGEYGNNNVSSSVRISNITFKGIRGKGGLVGGSFTCNSGDLSCYNITMIDVMLDTMLAGCHFQNVFGYGENVTPVSCIPPAEGTRFAQT